MQHVDEGRLHAWLDGELPPSGPEGARALERHLDECAACRAHADEERRVRDAASAILRAADPGEAPPGRVIPLPLPSSARGGRRARPWVALGWAASVLVALGTGWFARPTRDREIAVAPVSPSRAPAPGINAPAPVDVRSEAPATPAPAQPRTPDPRRALAVPHEAEATQPAQATSAPSAPSSAAASRSEEVVTEAVTMDEAPLAPPPPPPSVAAPPSPPPAPAARTLAGRVAVAAAPSAAADPSARKTPAGQGSAARAPAGDTITVRGIVTDPSGRALSGAQVTIPSLRIRTTTRADGSYILALPAERLADSIRVVASRLGNAVQTRTLASARDGEAPLNFALPTATLALEGVVVTSTPGALRTRRGPHWRDSNRTEAERRLGTPLFLVPDLPILGIQIDPAPGSRTVRVVQALPDGGEVSLVQRRASRAQTHTCDPQSRALAGAEDARTTVRKDGLVIDATAPVSPDSLRALLCPATE